MYTLLTYPLFRSSIGNRGWGEYITNFPKISNPMGYGTLSHTIYHYNPCIP